MSLRASLLLLILGLAACSGRNADRQIQMCLEDKEGLVKFREILVAIARTHQLEFFDQSKGREEGLKAVGSDLVGRYSIRDYHLHDKSAGIEISATNLGLGPYETTLSYDLRSDRQRTVARNLTDKLARNFQIVQTPDNRGAFPLLDCPQMQPEVARGT